MKEIVSKLFSLTDDEICSIMFTLYGDETLQNYGIVNSYEPNNEHRQFRRFDD